MRSHIAQIRSRHLPRRDARGFTLIELLITLTVLVVVMGAVMAMVYLSSKSKTASSEKIESVQGARVALDMMTSDLRSAGYSADINYPTTPQTPIAYIDSTQVLIAGRLLPAPPPVIDTFTVTLGHNLNSRPRAYDPAGSHRPFPLDGTAWQPPVKYRTGAEIIRYTLDANNDGVIDANDVSGSLAAKTQNPNDYVLTRQVYGDSLNGSAGDNGGTAQQIALVRKPGGTVPPMFTVYMKGATTPYDWANGPVPANQLANIERITVKVDATSASHDSKGKYQETVLSSEVNSMRNVPNFGGTQYGVSGYIFDDNGTLNGIKDAGEPGLPSVRVTLGNYSTYTDNTGYFLFRVFAGTYTLRHVPPAGYTVYTSPDSFRLTVNTSMQRSFADRTLPGGHVDVHVYQDLNNNHVYDAGEPGIQGITVKESPDSSTGTSDVNGLVAHLFAAPGNYTLTATLPDSFIVSSTPYPITGTMSNGGSSTVYLGLKKSLTGLVTGKVYRDNNRDGIWQTGEAGLQGVWVGVTNNGGTNILGYAYSDANGNYSIQVPINDPPHTTAYSVYCIPPAGSFPTSPTSIGGLWVQTSATLANNNFGVAAYTVISLNASRVLSLAAADLIENDWNGNQTQNAHGDTDLILGADAGGTDNISVWFNQYPASNHQALFNATPDYTRLAPNSVTSMAVDTLDSDATWKVRPDVVTGTKISASGNFFVWLTQNTSSNYGYLPTSYSTGLNYKTSDQGDVQSVVTLDCAGGAMPDIIVGTKSPTANNGTIEVWQNSDAVSPTFSRVETYPSAGSIPGNKMGEVNTMILADLDGDGRKDLIVGTKTGTTSGELIIFQNVSKSTGNRFLCRADINLTNDVATALAAADIDGDGRVDVVVGTQNATSGNLMLYHNTSTIGTNWVFSNTVTRAEQGLVMSITAADFGGTSRPDLAVGWRATPTSFLGGVDVWFTDVLGLPLSGTDPSAGSVVNMVPALTTGNFNFGTNPMATAPFLTDLAAGVKITATTGALVVFIR